MYHQLFNVIQIFQNKVLLSKLNNDYEFQLLMDHIYQGKLNLINSVLLSFKAYIIIKIIFLNKMIQIHFCFFNRLLILIFFYL